MCEEFVRDVPVGRVQGGSRERLGRQTTVCADHKETEGEEAGWVPLRLQCEQDCQRR